MSDAPAPFELWVGLYAARASTRVQPLLLDAYIRVSPEEDFRPWESGEIYPGSCTSPDRHDAGELLTAWWQDYASESETAGVVGSALRDPETFPRMADRPTTAEATRRAERVAAAFLERNPHARLGLVAADSGAHALSAVGWQGPLNYDNDTGKFAAVVAGWQERFGARVVAVGGGTLHLSVAAPPTGREDALALAHEHFAFCPDNVWQGSRPYTVGAYAEDLVNAEEWTFWWD
jgi:hypothetical protein